MRYKGYVVSYADEQLKVNKENFFVNGKCRENLEQLDVFQVNKSFGRRNFYAVTSGVKCDEAGDELSQVAVDVLKGFYGSDFADESRSYFGMANSAITGQVFDKRDKHFEVDISLLYIENDFATVYNFGDMPVFYYDNNNLKKLTGTSPDTVKIEKNVYDNRGTAHLQLLEKHNIPYIGFSSEECESVSYISEKIKLKHKGFFVLCSKAVLDVVGEKTIEDILADEKIKTGNKAVQIVDSAVKKFPEGNYTVLVVNVDKGIPVTDEDAKSAGIWSIIALLCAVLYFTSPYVLRAVSMFAESAKSVIEHYFRDDAEPEETLIWTPREDETEYHDETTDQIEEETEQDEDMPKAEPDEPQKRKASNVSKPAVNQQTPVQQITEEQPQQQQTEHQQQSEEPITTTPPETTEEVELPIDFN